MVLLCGNADTNKTRLWGRWKSEAMPTLILPFIRTYDCPAWELHPLPGGGGPSSGRGIKMASIIHACLNEHTAIWDAMGKKEGTALPTSSSKSVIPPNMK